VGGIGTKVGETTTNNDLGQTATPEALALILK